MAHRFRHQLLVMAMALSGGCSTAFASDEAEEAPLFRDDVLALLADMHKESASRLEQAQADILALHNAFEEKRLEFIDFYTTVSKQKAFKKTLASESVPEFDEHDESRNREFDEFRKLEAKNPAHLVETAAAHYRSPYPSKKRWKDEVTSDLSERERASILDFIKRDRKDLEAEGKRLDEVLSLCKSFLQPGSPIASKTDTPSTVTTNPTPRSVINAETVEFLRLKLEELAAEKGDGVDAEDFMAHIAKHYAALAGATPGSKAAFVEIIKQAFAGDFDDIVLSVNIAGDEEEESRGLGLFILALIQEGAKPHHWQDDEGQIIDDGLSEEDIIAYLEMAVALDMPTVVEGLGRSLDGYDKNQTISLAAKSRVLSLTEAEGLAWKLWHAYEQVKPEQSTVFVPTHKSLALTLTAFLASERYAPYNRRDLQLLEKALLAEIAKGEDGALYMSSVQELEKIYSFCRTWATKHTASGAPLSLQTGATNHNT